MPQGRMATPGEIAALALYMVSDEARFVTGAAYNIDGGIAGACVCVYTRLICACPSRSVVLCRFVCLALGLSCVGTCRLSAVFCALTSGVCMCSLFTPLSKTSKQFTTQQVYFHTCRRGPPEAVHHAPQRAPPLHHGQALNQTHQQTQNTEQR